MYIVMDTDLMALGLHSPKQLLLPLGMRAHDKKSRFRLIASEQIEQHRRIFRVRTIIKRKGNLLLGDPFLKYAKAEGPANQTWKKRIERCDV
ncbi:hypothetical protein D3C80_1824640 [compost metagenome]